jgi:hypothetical protein
MRHRFVIAILALGLGAGGIALADVPNQVAPPKKIVTVAVPAALKSGIDREQARLNARLTSDQRTKLTKASRSFAPQLTAQLKTGKPLKQADVMTGARKSLADQGIDFASMPIEEAVLLMFAMLAKDAAEDLREQLEAMRDLNKRRSELREQIEKMRDATAETKAEARAQYDRATELESQAEERAKLARDRHAKAIEMLATLPQLAAIDAGVPK